ncbi:hypothetical protein ACFYKX_15185 [Cytobacillus sp. FJAT-54145]|uniref:SnoaL-like domain-containing protein n=1 Tax=Cytobacillus spartinae TaxID=3299023 RepID=A0ABW6KCP5_9BACI
MSSIFKDYTPLKTSEEEKNAMLQKMRVVDKKWLQKKRFTKWYYNAAIMASILLILFISDLIMNKEQPLTGSTTASQSSASPAEISHIEKMAAQYLEMAYNIELNTIEQKIYETGLDFYDGNPYKALMTEAGYEDTFPAQPMSILRDALLLQSNFSIQNVSFQHRSYDDGYEFFVFNGKLKIKNSEHIKEHDLSGKIAFKQVDDEWKIVYVGTEYPIIQFPTRYRKLATTDLEYKEKLTSTTFFKENHEYIGVEGLWGISNYTDLDKGMEETFSLILHKDLIKEDFSEVFLQLTHIEGFNYDEIPFRFLYVNQGDSDGDLLELDIKGEFPRSGFYDLTLYVDGQPIGIVKYKVK